MIPQYYDLETTKKEDVTELPDTSSYALAIVNWGDAKSKLIVPGLFYFETLVLRPNWFRRFWYWTLLGWKWENV